MEAENLYTWIAYPVLGNELWRWIAAIIGALFVHVVIQRIVNRIAASQERHRKNGDVSLIQIVRHVLSVTSPNLIFLLALWLSITLFFNLPPRYAQIADGIAAFALFFQVGMWTDEAVSEFVMYRINRNKQHDVALNTASGIIRLFLRTVVWAVILLVILSNFGINISALVAGLGVGGIAVALAVQNILGDLLCSISIILDKPFVVGDFVIVDDTLGTIEYIGVKSTRIRSLHGEQIVISNSNLIASKIRNFKRMHERRVVLPIGVTYQTETEKLKRVPEIIKEIVTHIELARFDRSHFKGFGAFSLDFETVYWILSSDYYTFMEIQQQVNLAIVEHFRSEGIEFAYPTQTLFLERPDGSSFPAAGAPA